jgi:hypothetical protein
MKARDERAFCIWPPAGETAQLLLRYDGLIPSLGGQYFNPRVAPVAATVPFHDRQSAPGECGFPFMGIAAAPVVLSHQAVGGAVVVNLFNRTPESGCRTSGVVAQTTGRSE